MDNSSKVVTPRRPTWRRWTVRGICVAVLALVAIGFWCAYNALSGSLHAEKALHATQLTFEAVEDYVRQHDGAWPRSWNELERSSPQTSDAYSWAGGSNKIQEFVSVDFNANPDQLAKQAVAKFQAIKPVGPYYDNYTDHIPYLLEALRATRRPKVEMLKTKEQR
jgi:hypothetical protein